MLFGAVMHADAQPGGGWAVYAGYGSYDTSGVFQQNDPSAGVSAGDRFDINSDSGISLGVDYQFPVSGSTTVNPFLFITSEEGNSSQLDNLGLFGIDILGVEFRYWFSDWFIGVHSGLYGHDIFFDGVKLSSDSGSGAGLSLGWGISRNWFMLVQYDSASVEFGAGDMEYDGFAVNVGYRWTKSTGRPGIEIEP